MHPENKTGGIEDPDISKQMVASRLGKLGLHQLRDRSAALAREAAALGPFTEKIERDGFGDIVRREEPNTPAANYARAARGVIEEERKIVAGLLQEAEAVWKSKRSASPDHRTSRSARRAARLSGIEVGREEQIAANIKEKVAVAKVLKTRRADTRKQLEEGGKALEIGSTYRTIWAPGTSEVAFSLVVVMDKGTQAFQVVAGTAFGGKLFGNALNGRMYFDSARAQRDCREEAISAYNQQHPHGNLRSSAVVENINLPDEQTATIVIFRPSSADPVRYKVDFSDFVAEYEEARTGVFESQRQAKAAVDAAKDAIKARKDLSRRERRRGSEGRKEEDPPLGGFWGRGEDDY